jgi:hypothetical protein
MARQKAISVKIATPKIIKALENALAKLEKDFSTQEANEAKYQKAYKAWQVEIGKWAIANFAKSENLRTNYRNWNNTLNVDFDIITKEGSFPTEPERDFEQIGSHSYRESKKELENAIRILKMTDEETVNTSTYNAVSQYL